MKKLIITCLSALIVFTCSLPIAAQDKEVTVSYTEGESYEWSVPSTGIDLSENVTDQKVTVSNNMLKDGKKLQITVNSANDFYVVDDKHSTNKLQYELKAGDTVMTNGATVLEVEAGTSDAEQTLGFELLGTVTKAGDYKDTLTYTATVIEQETAVSSKDSQNSGETENNSVNYTSASPNLSSNVEFASGKASLTGVVTCNGKPMSGAVVKITDDSGVSHYIATYEGMYTVSDLPVGNVKVEVYTEEEGYSTYTGYVTLEAKKCSIFNAVLYKVSSDIECVESAGYNEYKIVFPNLLSESAYVPSAVISVPEEAIAIGEEICAANASYVLNDESIGLNLEYETCSGSLTSAVIAVDCQVEPAAVILNGNAVTSYAFENGILFLGVNETGTLQLLFSVKETSTSETKAVYGLVPNEFDGYSTQQNAQGNIDLINDFQVDESQILAQFAALKMGGYGSFSVAEYLTFNEIIPAGEKLIFTAYETEVMKNFKLEYQKASAVTGESVTTSTVDRVHKG